MASIESLLDSLSTVSGELHLAAFRCADDLRFGHGAPDTQQIKRWQKIAVEVEQLCEHMLVELDKDFLTER